MNLLNFLSYQQHKDFLYILEIALYIYKGIFTTLLYSMMAAFIGIIFGTILAILRYSSSSILLVFVKIYVSIIRGTPFLLQLFFVYFALPSALNINVPVLIAGVVALSFNSSAYVVEIIRGGIESIDKGQFEASKSLSIPYLKMMHHIILPQVFRSILPSLINEVVNLVKESAIIGVIGVSDLMRRVQIIAAEKYDFITPLCIAAVFYYIIIATIAYIGTTFEKRLNDKSN